MTGIRIVRGCVCALVALGAARFAAAQDEAPKSPAEKQYEEKAAKLGEKDVKGWLALADFCETKLLFDKRVEALKKAVEIDPNNADAHGRLDEVKVGDEWIPCAEADARAAKEHADKKEVFYAKAWMPEKSAESKLAGDRKKIGWDIKTRVDGKTCVVYSAASYEETQAVADAVDATTAGYAAMYGKVRRLSLSKPLVVLLFNSGDMLRAEFQRLGKTPTAIPKGFAGAYSPAAKMEFMSTDIGSTMWTLDTMLHTVAHESTHGLDDLGAGMDLNKMPTWIGEGRAIYAQYSLVGRQFLPGALNVPGTDGRGQDVEKAYKTVSLAGLLAMDHKTFMQAAAADYGVAWSFTHFLLHGEDGKYRDRFMKFVSGCPKNASAADFQKIVGKPADLEGPYRTYVEKVFLPAVKASVNADRKAKGLSGEWK